MSSEITEKAHVIITRDSERDIKMRGLEVFVDDTFLADLAFGDSCSHDVTPGEITVKVTNRLYTKRLTITLAAGETYHVQAGNYFGSVGGIMMAVFGFGPYKVFVGPETTVKAPVAAA